MDKILKQLNQVIKNYMALLVLIVAVVSLNWSWTFQWVAPNISFLLGIVMFGMGMTLSLQDFRKILDNPRDVFIGVLAQFTIMPGLAWFLIIGFDLPPDLAIGVVLVGACPGGTSSNVMTYLARGDVALSISMTLTSTLLAPFLTPLITWWLIGQWIDIPVLSMLISIFKIVILPIFFGVFFNTFSPNRIRSVVEGLPIVSILAILFIVGGVVSANSQRILESGMLVMAVVVICHNITGYFLGFLISRIFSMNVAKTKAISIEVGMQNSGLATSLAMLHFDIIAAVPGAIFSVWHNISGAVAANYFVKHNREFSNN